jgi:uncharacterized protein YcfL
MRNLHWLQLALVAGAFSLAGCKSTVNTVEPAQPTNLPRMVDDKRVLTDKSLGKAVRIVGLNDAIGSDGMRKLQVTVFNSTSSAARFNYKVEWFDAQGMLIGSPQAAPQYREILGGETLSLIATSPKTGVSDFRIQFYPAK